MILIICRKNILHQPSKLLGILSEAKLPINPTYTHTILIVIVFPTLPPIIMVFLRSADAAIKGSRSIREYWYYWIIQKREQMSFGSKCNKSVWIFKIFTTTEVFCTSYLFAFACTGMNWQLPLVSPIMLTLVFLERCSVLPHLMDGIIRYVAVM